MGTFSEIEQLHESAMQRTKRVPLLGREVSTLSAKDLVTLKMLFFRAKDLVDVEKLLARARRSR